MGRDGIGWAGVGLGYGGRIETDRDGISRLHQF